MTSQPLIEIETVRSQEALVRLCGDLRSAGRFALDTEFVGERTYVPKLCLIQVATAQFIALIDTFAVNDLGPFWSLIADPSIGKVLHAAREDLRLAYYGGGRLIPSGILDTQVAAGLVGLPQFPLSYAKLVAAITGVQLSKAETRSEWDRRPLSPDQIRYAKDDVRYLLPIADKLTEVLTRLKRLTWLQEEMRRFSDPLVYEPDPEVAYLRIRGARGGFTARPTALLRALAAWREREASARDVPARTILRDEVLLDLALRSPRRLTDLGRVRGFPPGEEAILGPDILEALDSGRSVAEEDLPAPLVATDDETPQERVIGDLIYALASAICLEHDIAPELAISRITASDLARKRTEASLLLGWRSEVFGNALQSMTNGKVSASIRVLAGKPHVSITDISSTLDEAVTDG